MEVRCTLKDILKERGLKHGYIAKKAGISDATLSALINERRLPTLPVALSIAKILDMNVEDIWKFSEG